MKKATVKADTAEKHSRHFASLPAWWYFYTRAVFPGDADTTCVAAGTRSVCVFEACKHLLHTLSGRSSRAQQGVVSTAPLEKIRWRVVDLYILCFLHLCRLRGKVGGRRGFRDGWYFYSESPATVKIYLRQLFIFCFCHLVVPCCIFV